MVHTTDPSLARLNAAKTYLVGAPLDTPPTDKDTPSDFIPCLYTLGSTYNVLNGEYADAKSTIQQVVDWSTTDVRSQEFGGQFYSVPEVVNFERYTTTDYRTSYGKTTEEYANSLSSKAGLDASFPGFSASASTDYSESQRENLSHAFTRTAYVVTHYNLSLPPTEHIKPLLKSWFVRDLDTMDGIELYRQYGTHLLRSLTVGGRGLFLTSTDTRSYSSEISIEVAAKMSASYFGVSGGADLSVEQKAAVDSFNESSECTVVTKGGDPRYGTEDFLQNREEWAASITAYPEFIDFASLPCLTGLWEFASTPARRDELQEAYAQFVTLYAQDLTLPGPFLRARINKDLDASLRASIVVGASGGYINYEFPGNRSDGWYYITPAVSTNGAVIVKELVPGALAEVEWKEIFVAPGAYSRSVRFWRAIPPTTDYLAMGVVAVMASSAGALPSQPPEALVGHFRAVHKSALTAALRGVTTRYVYENRWFFCVEKRYWFADTQLPLLLDCFKLDPKAVVLEGDGWDA
ncbi:hypothetical protein BC835DRAFT_210307 [Cytidiella melzeri]|nr:hypothetical protein BC835DRAFT_210307 [Cytidiella melzeri]